MTSNSREMDLVNERYAESELAAVGSFTDAMNLVGTAEEYGEVYGSGFRIVDDKTRLVGVDFLAIEWQFNQGDMGEFVSVAVMTEPGEKLIVNDGSTGICAQLRNVTEQRIASGRTPTEARRGLLVRGGLRVSEYPVQKDGTPLTKAEQQEHPELASGKGRTFYLST